MSPVSDWIACRTGLSGNLNPETLHNWQMQKLNEIVQYANNNCKFYKNKLKTTEDINDLPFTYPSDIANDPFAFLAIPQNQVARVTTLANSGTTTLRKRIFFSETDLELTKDFFSVGLSTMFNKNDHVSILISNRTENSLGSLISESLSRIGISSHIPGLLNSAKEAIEKTKNSNCLIGMPAEILYMSTLNPEYRPKSVLLTADYIPDSIVERIKNTWQCKVYSHYGHTEFGYGLAVDCDMHKGFHLRHADFVIEIIDTETGKACKNGGIGEIVVSSLYLGAMPLIRYRTGNLSSLINTPCACGCSLPRLGKIEGRIESNISIGDQVISIHQLDELIFTNSNVRGFNASLNIDKGIFTLILNIDSDLTIDKFKLKSKLPAQLLTVINYCNADPFLRREKRRIHSIKAGNFI
jgi:phenylacetate-coenzyme A ligase PaaK-like adenylate-forming protein